MECVVKQGAKWCAMSRRPRGCPVGRVEKIVTADVHLVGRKSSPTIRDYYVASSSDPSQNLTYQRGLANYSHVVLGDSRISYTKSMSQEMYSALEEAAVETQATKAPTAERDTERHLQYHQATALVSSAELDCMEQLMRDKLQQRTKTGPFQLRKTFKYFDRDGSGGIDLIEFTDAMELMGFQFSDMQILALFARYDVSRSGSVVYSEFVDKLMERDFWAIESAAAGRQLLEISSGVSTRECSSKDAVNAKESDEDSDLDDESVEAMRRDEVMRVFQMIDPEGSGTIDQRQMELLLLALGKRRTSQRVIHEFDMIDEKKAGVVTFQEFYAWFCRGSGHVW